MEITLEGMGGVQGILSGLTGAAKDLRPAFRDIHADFLKVEQQAFMSEGTSTGARWAPLNPRYAAWKQHRYPGRTILVGATGRLAKSLGRAGADHRFISSPLEAKMGTGVPYSVFHQTGTRRMPARPPIRLTNEVRVRWRTIIADYMRRLMTTRGGR